MKTALGGMASDAALRDMFTRLDTDNSGSIDRLELISAASQSTTNSAAQTAAQAVQTNSLLNSANSLSSSAVQLASTANDIGNYMANLLNSINGLQSTASAQLQLLNTQYAAQPFQVAAGGGVQNINNTMIQALNKIVFNTWATAANTSGGNHFLGVLANGGWITGGTPGKDSVPLSGGRYLGMPGEYVINYDVAQDNKDWLPSFNAGMGIPIPTISLPSLRSSNDNGDWKAVLAELRALRAELVEVKGNTGRTVGAVAAGAQHVRDGVDAATALQADTNKRARRAQ